MNPAMTPSKRDINQMVKTTVIEILRRECVIDTDDPAVIEQACVEQERLAQMILKRLNSTLPRT